MPTMKSILFVFTLLFSGMALRAAVSASPAMANHPIAIVMHGGAGTILRKNMTPQMEARYRASMKTALQTGYAVLKKGGTSLDAVQAAIQVLEDSPLFNAGKGSVFTHDGKNEMDAAIMDGKSLRAGAVADVQHIKNPIALARLVMDRTPHVLLVADGAEKFAQSQGMRLMPARYFYTRPRWQELQRALQAEKQGRKSFALEENYPGTTAHGFGTVGAVAVDRYGNIAAGTSTGGLTNKLDGRVGDSPIIGAGTYANNLTCGVSATGDGEYFMRLLVARSISDLMLYGHMHVEQAAEQVIMRQLVSFAGPDTGGVIAMDSDGDIAMPFNTPGMYRGYIDTHGNLVVKIFRDE